MKRTLWSAGLSVTGDWTGVVAHAGSAGLRLLADRTGLTGEVSKALARRGFIPGHDRGQMLLDVAVMVVDGGEAALSCSAATACAAPVPSAATPASRPRCGWSARALC